MANWFEKIKKYYDAGLWTEKWSVMRWRRRKSPPSSTRKSPARTTTSKNHRKFYTYDRAEARKGNIMYPNNIYIKNYATVKKYAGDIGVQLDKFDNDHGLKHNALLRAQYKHWRSVQTGVPELLSVADKRLLGLL